MVLNLRGASQHKAEFKFKYETHRVLYAIEGR
jgi:hypothetical protein